MVIRKLTLVVLASALFFICTLLILSLSIYSFLYPDIYIKALREADAFSYAQTQLEQMPSASFIKIPQGGLEVVVTPLLSNLLSYLRGSSETLDLSVEVDTPKLRQFFLHSINQVPICQPGQSYSFNDLEHICRPREKSQEMFLDELLASQNKSFFASNTTDLAEIYGLEEGSAGRAQLDSIRDYTRYYTLGLIVLGLVILLLLVGIYFVTASLKGSMRWAGIPIFVSGMIVLVGAWYVAGFIDALYMSNPLLQPIKNILHELVHTCIQPIYWYSSGAAILGLVALIVSFVIREKTVEKIGS